MASRDDVVAIGERLPGVKAGSWWGTLDDKQALLRGDPGTYFTTPHYDGSPHVLVRLEATDEDELAALIEDAWRLTAPRPLVDAHEEGV